MRAVNMSPAITRYGLTWTAGAVIVLMLLLSASSGNGACPSSASIHPCFCEETEDAQLLVTCKNGRADEVFLAIGNIQDVVEELRIEYCDDMTTVASDAFGGTSARKLFMVHSGIEEIAAGAFNGLEVDLVELNLGWNNLRSFPSKAITGFQTLTSLTLSDNAISEIKKQDIVSMNDLQMLDLSRNQIAYIEDSGFSGLNNLEKLYLESNELTEIRASMFDNLSDLQALSLGRNKLKHITASAFTQVKNLVSLTLELQEIAKVEAGAFDGLVFLQSLNLFTNDISELSPDLFNDLTSLTSLDLHVNNITMIAGETFQNLASLQYLNLAYNKISDLSAASFKGLSNLTHLILLSNQLEAFPEGIFDDPLMLNYLHLGNNPKLSIPAGCFTQLESLLILYLSNLNIEQLAAGTLAGLFTLEYLYLEGSGINAIETGAFADLHSLQNLYLSHNQLQSLQLGAFDGLTKLRRLELDHNTQLMLIDGAAMHVMEDTLEYLTLNSGQLDERVFAALRSMRKLQQLDIGSNLIESLPAAALRDATSLAWLGLDGNAIEFVCPSALEGLANLKTLSMNFNSLMSIPDYTFGEHYPPLHTVELQGNPLACDCHLTHLLPTDNLRGECSSPASMQGRLLYELQATNLTCAKPYVPADVQGRCATGHIQMQVTAVMDTLADVTWTYIPAPSDATRPIEDWHLQQYFVAAAGELDSGLTYLQEQRVELESALEKQETNTFAGLLPSTGYLLCIHAFTDQYGADDDDDSLLESECVNVRTLSTPALTFAGDQLAVYIVTTVALYTLIVFLVCMVCYCRAKNNSSKKTRADTRDSVGDGDVHNIMYDVHTVPEPDPSAVTSF
ncbi:PREDICTED: leucine-rich repeat-containing protein 15-like [Priapulus caudatus]|uniref:Leucine-rich repeat-containing protein 15-like n=1 Tax=Priapulus caudatus TaxID=37621 RepID=A0ABM1E4A1_PRICU|nr:PREDICTED: leucine-rich repeat-containing protein 15-like [Priapulus caudatus]